MAAVAGRTIRWAIHLDAPVERVYAALDSAADRARFWAESAAEQDGVIEFVFINGTTHRARVLTREPPRKWAIQYFGGPATFVLAADGRGGTDVWLTHENVDDDEWVDVHAGWLNVLLPLKAWVQYGVDLRNHDPGRTWDEGYADQ